MSESALIQLHRHTYGSTSPETVKMWLLAPHAASPFGLLSTSSRIALRSNFHNVATSETRHSISPSLILHPASPRQPATPLRWLPHNGHLTLSLPHLILPPNQHFHPTHSMKMRLAWYAGVSACRVSCPAVALRSCSSLVGARWSFEELTPNPPSNAPTS